MISALLLLLVGFLVLSVAGGVYLTRNALRPASALAGTARAVIQSGDLSRRVEVRKSRGELDELVLLFNGVLDRNQALVRGMRDALDNVAHDLRTPLTRLRGTAEFALGSADIGKAREALADCIDETDQVLVMLRTLMDISEAEAGIMRLELQRVDVAGLAGETVELYSHVADERGVAFSLVESPPVIAVVDPNRVRQALANLVDNALKYTARGGAVRLSVEPRDADVEIRVNDTGRGIPSAAIPRIWDRLFRVDPSRSERGLGLGLSLVRAIAVAHGGRVAVESVPDHGSTFLLALPRGDGLGELQKLSSVHSLSSRGDRRTRTTMIRAHRSQPAPIGAYRVDAPFCVREGGHVSGDELSHGKVEAGSV
ncbi:MAG TPA: HAMP domain-containing sensor histidine kinase [Polyangia bacterium]|nr:HAMP domain-containing sensor histidine kinase [Polyangia bacterium]